MPLVACRLPEMMKDKGPIWDRLVQASTSRQWTHLGACLAPDFQHRLVRYCKNEGQNPIWERLCRQMVPVTETCFAALRVA